MAKDDKNTEVEEPVAESGVETPSEITTQAAVKKESRADRAAAMAAENASTAFSTSGVKGRDDRAESMAAENAAASTPIPDDERGDRADRAAAMAAENAATATTISD